MRLRSQSKGESESKKFKSNDDSNYAATDMTLSSTFAEEESSESESELPVASEIQDKERLWNEGSDWNKISFPIPDSSERHTMSLRSKAKDQQQSESKENALKAHEQLQKLESADDQSSSEDTFEQTKSELEGYSGQEKSKKYVQIQKDTKNLSSCDSDTEKQNVESNSSYQEYEEFDQSELIAGSSPSGSENQYRVRQISFSYESVIEEEEDDESEVSGAEYIVQELEKDRKAQEEFERQQQIEAEVKDTKSNADDMAEDLKTDQQVSLETSADNETSGASPIQGRNN